jgi:hypothetical protein
MAGKARSEAGEPGARLPAELLAEVEVDPDAFVAVLDGLAEAAALPRRKRPDMMTVTVESYCDFYGLDPDAATTPEDIVEMAALAARISAAAEVMAQAGIVADPHRVTAMATAACSARLIDKDGRPAFQLLDFLAVMARAEALERPSG